MLKAMTEQSELSRRYRTSAGSIFGVVLLVGMPLAAADDNPSRSWRSHSPNVSC